MSAREVLSLEAYQAELGTLVVPDERVERAPIPAGRGRVLARTIRGRVGIPAFDNSAMDGYAVRFAEASAVPVRLRVTGEVVAGSTNDPATAAGACVRIMTGAPLPTFADSVVPVEDTDGGTDIVEIRRAPGAVGAHVRRAGEDVEAGAMIAVAGQVLTPAAVAAVAAAGHTSVPVRPRPLLAVAATGDELVTDGSELAPGQIHESNSLALAAAIERDGAVVVGRAVIPDDAESLRSWLDTAAATADLIVLTGGASVGAHDVARDLLTESGHGVYRHVRVQPGKPQGWGRWRGVPVVALPGNPLSAALGYEVLVRPLLDRRLGRPAPPEFRAVAGIGWTSPAGRCQLVPVVLATDDIGRLIATPSHARGSASHTVTALAAADAVAFVPEEVAQVRPGDVMRVRWLR